VLCLLQLQRPFKGSWVALGFSSFKLLSKPVRNILRVIEMKNRLVSKKPSVFRVVDTEPFITVSQFSIVNCTTYRKIIGGNRQTQQSEACWILPLSNSK
jgi:hypothetical protein